VDVAYGSFREGATEEFCHGRIEYNGAIFVLRVTTVEVTSETSDKEMDYAHGQTSVMAVGNEDGAAIFGEIQRPI
jgi:hypothetical protein